MTYDDRERPAQLPTGVAGSGEKRRKVGLGDTNRAAEAMHRQQAGGDPAPDLALAIAELLGHLADGEERTRASDRTDAAAGHRTTPLQAGGGPTPRPSPSRARHGAPVPAPVRAGQSPAARQRNDQDGAGAASCSARSAQGRRSKGGKTSRVGGLDYWGSASRSSPTCLDVARPSATRAEQPWTRCYRTRLGSVLESAPGRRRTSPSWPAGPRRF